MPTERLPVRNVLSPLLRAGLVALAAFGMVGCGGASSDGGTATPVAATPSSTAIATPTPVPTATPDSPATYIVKTGDTAWDIALRFGITVEQLAAANNKTVQDLTVIRVGETIVIPR